MTKMLTQFIEQENCHTLDFYLKNGGYNQAKRAILEMSADEIIEIAKQSNLRGRGGAGFPAGMKWSFIPRDIDKPKYLISNADEGEPGTFKDRVLLSKNPHQMFDGMIIAAKAIDCHLAFVYIRGEFKKEAEILENAIAEAKEKNILGKRIFGSDFDFDIIVHRGAGAYICGEETALIESIEGKRGQPRIKPPFPAIEGYLQCPTVVNNVETFAALPPIFENGAQWFVDLGVENSAGTKLFSISGHVKNPGVFEVPMGTPLHDLIYNDEFCGGMKDDIPLKSVIPGGSSSPILTAKEIDGLTMDYDAIQKAGSMLGSGAVIVMNETTDMVQVCYNLARFYAHESCGQCTPCREGTAWLIKILKRFTSGGARQEDIELLLDITDNIGGLVDFSQGSFGKTICPFGEAVSWPVRALVEKFLPEFEKRVQEK